MNSVHVPGLIYFTFIVFPDENRAVVIRFQLRLFDPSVGYSMQRLVLRKSYLIKVDQKPTAFENT